ncbi:MAG: hypothetical protein VYE77_00555 [Planctomycetota bacterium]|nr:hypothetical protein [Planctomycetota bacterium]
MEQATWTFLAGRAEPRSDGNGHDTTPRPGRRRRADRLPTAPCRSWTALVAALLLAASATAQTLRLQNLAPRARQETATVVVPFARGTVMRTPDLHVEDTATVWQPFGARWPDGSVRQALCLFRTEVPALGETSLQLTQGAGPPPPEGDFAMPDATIRVVARIDGKTTTAEPTHREWLEQNALRKVELRQARLGNTGLIAELIVAQSRGDAHAYVNVAVFFSDPRLKAMFCMIEELAVEAEGMALLFRHPGRSGITQETTETGSRAVLLKDSHIADGQGLRRNGALLPRLRGDNGIEDNTTLAAMICPLLGATSWKGTKAFGPFGEPAPMPPWLEGNGLRGMLAKRHAGFVAGEKPGGDPFHANTFGLAKNAGQTGDQRDFGVVKLSPVAASGLPSLLFEMEASVLQESCRPVHYFEADGRMVQAAEHPKWIVWSGRTHWHSGVSPDRLGKPHPPPSYSKHGWTGKDRQHWSSNYIGAYAQLTGAHWARREFEHEAQLYLSGQTVRRGLSTSGAGAPRGAGRTLLAACWTYLVTGNEDVKQRMNERIDKVYFPQWPGRKLEDEQVRTMQIAGRDNRMLRGKSRYWTPWQDALAAVGFAAAWHITGNKLARRLAEELALNVVRHGYLINDKDCMIAMAMRWQDGAPLSPQQILDSDPLDVAWSRGTAFTEWAHGAVEIARVAAQSRGDTVIEERAKEIQRRVGNRQRRPRDGYIDRLSEWNAVHWPAPDRD